MNNMPHFRRAAARDAVLAGVALVVLLVAGYLFWNRDSNSDLHAEANWTYLRCESCKNEFHMDALQIDQALRKKEFVNASKQPMEQDLRFKCSKCGEMKAQPVAKPGG